MTNNIEKKLTSTEIIIDEIANTILSGELKPGDKLLTEREFAEKYHVTRSCVREAIRSLSLIGMIEIRPGGGSYVADAQKEIPENTVLWMYHRRPETRRSYSRPECSAGPRRGRRSSS